MRLTRSTLLFLLKSIVLVALGFVIYFQIFKSENYTNISQIFLSQINTSHWPYLLIVIILMPINWMLETTKWYWLVKEYENIKFITAIKAILLGIVMALITPARIGEYAGRLSIVEEKSKSIGATLLGSIAQNLITLIAGIMAVIMFLERFTDISTTTTNLYTILITSLTLLFTWLYYHMESSLGFLSKFPFIRKHLRHFSNLNSYSNSLLTKVLFLSFLRYSVYLTQYFLLLLFFGIEADYIIMIAGIAILFLIQSGIPLPPVLSIFARGELAVLIWANISDNTIAAIAVSFALWIINLIIPSLIGLIVMFKSKLYSDINKETLSES